jgi:tripartite-type tricarboxylate transporter receptor subunit TctC
MLKLLVFSTKDNPGRIPYKGSAQALTDLLAGQVQMSFDTVALFLPHIEAGKLTALAVADATRSPQLLAVPTTAESGFATLQSTFWAGVVAPAGTSPSIVNKLNATINEILKSPELEANLVKINAKPKIGSPEDFANVHGCGDAEMDESHKFGWHEGRFIPNCSDPQNCWRICH